MAQTSSLLPTLATIGFLAILAYCAASFSHAASMSILNAGTAKGGLAFSQQELSLSFETHRLTTRSAPPPVRVMPKPHQAPSHHPARRLRRHCTL